MEHFGNKNVLWTLAWLVLGGVSLASSLSKIGKDSVLAFLILIMAGVFLLNAVKHFSLFRAAND